MITINSLLFTCEHPKVITTRDNRRMVVSCGKCRSCLIQRMRSKSLVCAEQEKLSRYTFFVTLTYDRYNVPKMYPVYLKDTAVNRQYVELYDEETGELVSSCYYPHSKVKQIMSRCDDKKLHYSRYSDLQKFVKRLRRRVSTNNKYNNEKIKYYSVSEYGPRTFRPHFHVLFYFDNPELAQDFGVLVHKAWSLGYTYTTLSHGGVSSYVASYVNSLVFVPEIFKGHATRAKSSHSSLLALPICQDQFKADVKNVSPKLVRPVERTKDGVRTTNAPWRSFKSYLFPKCFRYAYKSFYERVATYGLLSTIIRRYGEKPTIKEYIPLIKRDYYNNLLRPNIGNYLLSSDDNGYILPTDDILLGRLYQLKHYQNLMSIFGLSSYQLARNIDIFYSRLDYQNLIEMYATICESEHTLCSSDYDLFSQVYAYNTQYYEHDVVQYNGILLEVDLVKELYEKSGIYTSLVNSRKTAYQQSIKHKYLNDLNQIFIVNHEQCNEYEID